MLQFFLIWQNKDLFKKNYVVYSKISQLKLFSELSISTLVPKKCLLFASIEGKNNSAQWIISKVNFSPESFQNKMHILEPHHSLLRPICKTLQYAFFLRYQLCCCGPWNTQNLPPRTLDTGYCSHKAANSDEKNSRFWFIVPKQPFWCLSPACGLENDCTQNCWQSQLWINNFPCHFHCRKSSTGLSSIFETFTNSFRKVNILHINFFVAKNFNRKLHLKTQTV